MTTKHEKPHQIILEICSVVNRDAVDAESTQWVRSVFLLKWTALP